MASLFPLDRFSSYWGTAELRLTIGAGSRVQPSSRCTRPCQPGAMGWQRHLKELFDADENKAKGLLGSADGKPLPQPRLRDSQLVDGVRHAKLMAAETDGSLFTTAGDEKLAPVEAKKRIPTREQLKIEWQESAEILAWFNARLGHEFASWRLQSGRRGVLRRNGTGGVQLQSNVNEEPEYQPTCHGVA